MAEHRPGGEPTEPPSDKKLQRARRQGDVPRSREVTSAAVFIASAAALAGCWPLIHGQLGELLRQTLRAAAGGQISPAIALCGGANVMAVAAAPVLLAGLLAALVASFAQVRGLVTLRPLRPQLKRLAPASNLKQIFGKQAAVELLKTLIKIGGVGYVALIVSWDHAPSLLATVGAPPDVTLERLGSCLGAIAVRVGLLVAGLAAIDLLYQRRLYLRRQRMTKAEVKREQREAEGDPERRAERQRLQREVLEHLMVEAVATADCVIINPTRLAVALRYDAEAMHAPKVVARGRQLAAARIRAIARRHGVPIVRDVPLARALSELELDQEIPPELYEAVAEVLRFVLRISDEG